MANKVDIATDTSALLLGAVSGGLAGWGQDVFFTIMLSAIGATVSAVVNHLVKNRLKKK